MNPDSESCRPNMSRVTIFITNLLARYSRSHTLPEPASILLCRLEERGRTSHHAGQGLVDRSTSYHGSHRYCRFGSST
jgi:hypothetical protein